MWSASTHVRRRVENWDADTHSITRPDYTATSVCIHTVLLNTPSIKDCYSIKMTRSFDHVWIDFLLGLPVRYWNRKWVEDVGVCVSVCNPPWLQSQQLDKQSEHHKATWQSFSLTNSSHSAEPTCNIQYKRVLEIENLSLHIPLLHAYCLLNTFLPCFYGDMYERMRYLTPAGDCTCSVDSSLNHKTKTRHSLNFLIIITANPLIYSNHPLTSQWGSVWLSTVCDEIQCAPLLSL